MAPETAGSFEELVISPPAACAPASTQPVSCRGSTRSCARHVRDSNGGRPPPSRRLRCRRCTPPPPPRQCFARGPPPAGDRGPRCDWIGRDGVGKDWRFRLARHPPPPARREETGHLLPGAHPPPGWRCCEAEAAQVLAPTRELAFQIRDTFEALGVNACTRVAAGGAGAGLTTLQAAVGLKTAVIVGGIDMMSQAIALQAKPHVLVVRGPPGGVGGSLRRLRGRRRPAASWTTWRTPRASISSR